jgi:peptidoglycan-associated lipoprotein
MRRSLVPRRTAEGSTTSSPGPTLRLRRGPGMPRVRMSVLLVLFMTGCNAPDEAATPSSSGAVARDSGSAESRATAPVYRYESWILEDRVFFAFDKSELAAESLQTLRQVAYVMRTVPDRQFTIEGHTDERGTREYNVALGLRRAVAVRDALVALDVPQNRLAVVSYGKERPVVLGDNEQAWKQNRRAVIANILDVRSPR